MELLLWIETTDGGRFCSVIVSLKEHDAAVGD